MYGMKTAFSQLFFKYSHEYNSVIVVLINATQELQTKTSSIVIDLILCKFTALNKFT
jgi:hypothetical protein